MFLFVLCATVGGAHFARFSFPYRNLARTLLFYEGECGAVELLTTYSGLCVLVLDPVLCRRNCCVGRSVCVVGVLCSFADSFSGCIVCIIVFVCCAFACIFGGAGGWHAAKPLGVINNVLRANRTKGNAKTNEPGADVWPTHTPTHTPSNSVILYILFCATVCSNTV